MDSRTAFNVIESGVSDGRPMLFAHGFGCDQNMWRFVAPAFEVDHRVVRFDYVGSGGARQPYDPSRYASLEGYAEDVLQICSELELRDVVFVGHSVSAMVGVLAERRAPEIFGALVMIGPSPCYINMPDYVGGFEVSDIEGLLGALESNYMGWSAAMAPVIMDNLDRPELASELEKSFCTVDPAIAQRFARATFLSDNRADLAHVSTPTLVVQASRDAIAPVEVGQFVAGAIPDAELVVLEAVGHCPHLSAPDAVVSAVRGYLSAKRTAGV